MNIGNTSAYQHRKNFAKELKDIAPISQKRTVEAITKLDSVNEKTFKGGCDFLLKWFRIEGNYFLS